MSKKDQIIAAQAAEIHRLERQIAWLKDLVDRAMVRKVRDMETR